MNGQRVLINTDGMRGPEIEKPKATGTRRIMSLGGSIAFGEGIARRDTYTIDAIRDLGGSRVGLEALIMAVPEYTILQTRNLMDMRGWAMDPDLVIIAGPDAELEIGAYQDEDVISIYRGLTETHRQMESLALFRILDHWVRVKKDGRRQLETQSSLVSSQSIMTSALASAPMPMPATSTPSFGPRAAMMSRWSSSSHQCQRTSTTMMPHQS